VVRSEIINGNSLEELKKFPDNYFHSVVTDPPYGLSFMGKKWDYDVPSVELWQEVFRVLKEGGYLLSFAGTRTQHRMAVNIEDAGFEIRDMIAWVYGSGFPKSHNIGKAVDKLQGNEREIIREEKEPIKTGGNVNWDMRSSSRKLDKGTSEWEGWGTALKPALEPITMARKPFKGTVAENVLKNGVGGINIDGCRIEINIDDTGGFRPNCADKTYGKSMFLSSKTPRVSQKHPQGRFPANFIHDGSEEVKDLFPESKSTQSKGVKRNPKSEDAVWDNKNNGLQNGSTELEGFNDSGSASRFFYCAKASKQDRNEGLEDFEEKDCGRNTTRRCGNCNKPIVGLSQKDKCSCSNRVEIQTKNKNNHPTVKPTELMRYLVRLVTPKNGIVLDCFMGSGSTGKACAYEGFNFVGIDLDKDYCKIAKARIDKAIEDKRIMESQTKLF